MIVDPNLPELRAEREQPKVTNEAHVDHERRVVTIRQRVGLALPQTVQIPFYAWKEIALQIAAGEINAERVQLGGLVVQSHLQPAHTT